MSSSAAKPASTIRVLLLEHCPVVREGLIQWLGRHSGFEVCDQVGTPAEAGVAVVRTRPDALLMDVMPGGTDGISLIRALLAAHPTVRILVFSHHDERLYAERVLRAGATGYVSKCAMESEVLTALRTGATGGIYASPRLSLMLLDRLLRPGHKPAGKTGIASLTDRELHVFQLLGAGMSVREIGTRLGVSIKTVQAHRENIKNKLGFEKTAELLRHAALWLGEQGGARQRSREGSEGDEG